MCGRFVATDQSLPISEALSRIFLLAITPIYLNQTSEHVHVRSVLRTGMGLEL